MMVRDIAEALSAQVLGDGAIQVERIVHPAAAEKPSDLAVAMSGEAFSALSGSCALAAVVSAKSTPPRDKLKAVIVVAQGRETLAKLTALFDKGPAHQPGVHVTAVVAADASLGKDVSVGAFTVIGPRSRIGAGTVILSNVSVGADVTIGDSSLIHSGVRIGDRVRAGARLVVHSNAVIGADGFSFGLTPDPGLQKRFTPDVTIRRIHSLGGVVIGDDVEIGASTTIDRATLDDTRIGSGTKIDNLVQIAHNVTIGENCLICGMVGISGSSIIGDRVRIGGGAGVADHVRVGNEVMIAAGSGVGSNVEDGLVMSGYPALRHDRSAEHFTNVARLKALYKKIDEMHGRIEALEKEAKRQQTRT